MGFEANCAWSFRRRDASRAARWHTSVFFLEPSNLGVDYQEYFGIEGEKAILAQAESILAGNVPYFGELRSLVDFRRDGSKILLPAKEFHRSSRGRRCVLPPPSTAI